MTSPARIRSPVSSQVSRTAAGSGLSPDSILPAGNVHGGFPQGPRIRKLCSRQCSIYEYRFRRVSRAYTHSHDPVQSHSSVADRMRPSPARKPSAQAESVCVPDGTRAATEGGAFYTSLMAGYQDELTGIRAVRGRATDVPQDSPDLL